MYLTAIRSVPAAGAVCCGDAVDVRHDHRGVQIVLVDGLGHGEMAARAASRCLQALPEKIECGALTILDHLDAALRDTVGAAIGVLTLDSCGRTGSFAGVGNVRCRYLGMGQTTLIGTPGIAGTGDRAGPEVTFPVVAETPVVMFTDGISPGFALMDVPRKSRGNADWVAGMIAGRFSLSRDDATVAVAVWTNEVKQ